MGRCCSCGVCRTRAAEQSALSVGSQVPDYRVRQGGWCQLWGLHTVHEQSYNLPSKVKHAWIHESYVSALSGFSSRTSATTNPRF